MNYENLNRMADYLRLADDENLRVEQKLALAVSGWFLGEGQGQQNLNGLTVIGASGCTHSSLPGTSASGTAP